MIITKKAIPRRTVLRGLGVTVALPLLDSMAPALSALSRTEATGVRRFTVVYAAHGAAPGYWIPKAVGREYELTLPLQPLHARMNGASRGPSTRSFSVVCATPSSAKRRAARSSSASASARPSSTPARSPGLARSSAVVTAARSA